MTKDKETNDKTNESDVVKVQLTKVHVGSFVGTIASVAVVTGVVGLGIEWLRAKILD